MFKKSVERGVIITCIVALREGDRIYFGGDSCVGGAHQRILGQPKVFKRSEFLFGASGFLRGLQLLAYTVEMPVITEGQDHMHFMINTLTPHMRKAFAEHGALKTEKGLTNLSETAFLVAFRGEIYYIGADSAVDKWTEGYGAIGSGSAYALGSLYSTQRMLPENRIKLALDAASRYGDGVCPPYDIISIKWDGYNTGDDYRFFDSDGAVKEYVLECFTEEGEENDNSSD